MKTAKLRYVADVLRAGHHGSKKSTMPGSLAAEHHRVRLTSAGEDNPSWHANPELLKRLETVRVRILCTGPRSAVHILKHGKRSQLLRGVSGCIHKDGSSTGANRHIKRSKASKSKKPIAA
jgi:beta-lactamase superfamily II metal-dependent hydrolase